MMRRARSVLSYLQHLTTSKPLMGGLLVVALILSGGALLQRQTAVDAATCRDNDIIRCGITSGEDLQNKVNQNESGDLPAIMEHYNINIDAVSKEAVDGTAYKDGTIKVDGRTVATDVWSVGRSEQSFSNPVTIDGATYHESKNSDILQSDGLPVLVMMDRGSFQYATIKSCGNPAWGKATSEPEPVATVAAASTPVRTAASRQDSQPTVYTCTDIRAIRLDDNDAGKRVYQFEITFRAEGGAMLRDARFEFEDAETQRGLVPESQGDNTITSNEVVFDSPGSKNARAVLRFDVDGRSRSISDPECATTVRIPGEGEIVVCRNGETVIIDQEERRESDLDEDAGECQDAPAPSPSELQTDNTAAIPNTGPAGVIGGALGLGSLVGAGYYFYASRRDVRNLSPSNKR